MARGIFIFITVIAAITSANAASLRGVSTAARGGAATPQNQLVNPASSYTYNYMYPYLNNQMRTTLRPLDPTSPSTSPINAIVRTEKMSEPRRVVSRPTPVANSARAATANTAGGTTPQRRVVSRAATNTNMVRAATSTATTSPRRVVARAASRATESTPVMSPNAAQIVTPARCLADYADCMNRYCERADTAYNRCYCSAKLAQIDAEYQPQIESLVGQIIMLKSGATSIDNDEFNEYWTEKIGQYTGGNSWTNIDDALNIDWSTMESRVRGQNAFITGHEYCSQHIAGCFYMADNLRDAYRSSISQDCAKYKSGLERLKTVAESVIKEYTE